MKALYIPLPEIVHPWYDDFVAGIDGRYPVELFNISQPIPDQLKGIGVVTELGGSVATHEMVDIAVQEGVRLWQISGAGLDQVDVAYFLAKGMPLAHTPGPYSAVALAEHALYLMLCLAKNLHGSQKSIASKTLCAPINQELCASTLAVIGLGASGRELAKRAWQMGMRILAVDCIEVPESLCNELHLDQFAGPAELDRVLAEADYVSLHLPLTLQTKHIMDRRALGRMKPTAFLINVARGELVDEVALLEALRVGQLKGVGLDVFAVEPLDPTHPLLRMDNVVITPHTAGVTYGTSRRRGQILAENVVRVDQGLGPLHLVTSA